MDASPEAVARIRREIDLDDPRRIAIFGIAPERRLGEISRQLSLEDVVTPVEQAIASLDRALRLFQSLPPPRWLSTLKRFLAVKPPPSRDERLQEIFVEIREDLQDLERRLAGMGDSKGKLAEIEHEIRAHIMAAEETLACDPTHSGAIALRDRLMSLETSRTIAALTDANLRQYEENYRQLTAQLRAVLGPGASSWLVSDRSRSEAWTTAQSRVRECLTAATALRVALRGESSPD